MSCHTYFSANSFDSYQRKPGPTVRRVRCSSRRCFSWNEAWAVRIHAFRNLLPSRFWRTWIQTILPFLCSGTCSASDLNANIASTRRRLKEDKTASFTGVALVPLGRRFDTVLRPGLGAIGPLEGLAV